MIPATKPVNSDDSAPERPDDGGAVLDEARTSEKAGDPAAQLAREQAMRQEAETARATLRAVFESVPGSYLVLTSDDDYRIVGVTEAYLKATMTERAAIVDRGLFEVFPDDPDEPESDSTENLAASLERVRQTRATDVMAVQRYPIRRPEADGGGFEERYWSPINAPVLSTEGELVYIIHRVEDVTEFMQDSQREAVQDEMPSMSQSRAVHLEAEIVRRSQELENAHQKILASESRYHQLIDTLPAAVYTCDARGRVTLYNEAAALLWGRDPEIGKDRWCGSWRIYLPDGTRLQLDECPMALAVKTGRPARGEIVIEHPGGDRINVLANATPLFDESGIVAGAINLLMDNTEQRRSEEAQARLAAIVESSDDAIISKDLNGIVRSWNRGAERMFGYTEEEMIGQSITRVIPPHLYDEERRILQGLRKGHRFEQFETVRCGKDGHRLDVSLTISPVHNAAGKVTGASKIARDISEQKRVAEALADADRRKDEFLAMLAHELRNPLAAVSSAAELLGLPDGSEHLDSGRRIIERQTGHLVRLVDDLLDVSRISRGIVTLRKEILDVQTVIERAVEAVRPLIDARRHALDVSVGEYPLWLEGDPTRVEQFIANLLGNAAKYTEPGGHIQLEAERRGDKLEIAVRDNGIGISKELLPQVFELFSQYDQSPDRAAGGLGIGLTLVKSLVEMHGGSIEARSEGPGQGSEFIVRLPALEKHDVPQSKPARPAPPANSAPARRILVVDDNRDAAMGLSRLLEISGHTLQQAYDGPSALEAAEAFKPDAILLDIGLPDLDGYEVAKHIRQTPELQNVVLIAISGYCQDEDRKRSRDAGFDHHLPKPTDRQELLALLAADRT